MSLILVEDIFLQIFKYIWELSDYKSLFLYLLINKRISAIIISHFYNSFWQDPFCCEKSTEIIISCYLHKDPKPSNYLHPLNIFNEPSYFEKKPFYNYAVFAKKMDL